jgi:Spy/CpxP family protein refolding chaperone
MQRTIRRILVSSLPAVLLLFSPAALAQPMGPPHGGRGGPGGPGEIGHYLMLVHRAGLSDSQQQQIRALLDTGRTSTKPLLDRIRSGHQALEAKLYGQSTPSAGDLAAAATELSQLHAQIEASDLQTLLKIRALLTPDQLVTVNGLHDKLESLRQQTEDILGPPLGPPELPAPPMMP